MSEMEFNDGIEKSAARKKAIYKLANLASQVFREEANLDQLVYGLHTAREVLAQVLSPEKRQWFEGTPYMALVMDAPMKYERQIRIKNAELCYKARLSMYKNAGLI